MDSLGINAPKQSELVKSLVWLVSSGDVEAQHAFGIASLNGKGVDANLEKGAEWLKMATSTSHVGTIEKLKAFMIANFRAGFCIFCMISE